MRAAKVWGYYCIAVFLLIGFLRFLMMLYSIILGQAKSIQANEIAMNFNFYKLIGKQMTQCFTSIKTSNWS